jgi:hypothetical protein
MAIPCNEIAQAADELKMIFEACEVLKASDLQRLVDLVASVSICSNGGTEYNNTISDTLAPITGELIQTYPIGSYHNIYVRVIVGTVIYNGITLPVNSEIRDEVTSLNNTPFTITIPNGSEVLVVINN